MARPYYAASQIPPQTKETGRVPVCCESDGFLNVEHPSPSTEDARETRLCEVLLGGTLNVAWPNLSSQFVFET
jgi:hypothetical protein